MRIYQVWIIMNNGICPIHLRFSGQILEENLFAAFVRALFSFSKDMSEGEKSISSMTLGDMNIHYLAQQDEKFFVAISAEVGISQEDIDLYLEYISNLFTLYYPEYIEKLPPSEPGSFQLFRQAIEFFILFTENKILQSTQGKKDLDLKSDLKSIQFSINNIIIESSDNAILKILNKHDLAITGTFYPKDGNILVYSIQRSEKYLIILSDLNTMTIIPFLKNVENKNVQTVTLEINVFWLKIHPNDDIVYFGTETEIFEYNIDSQKTNKFTISRSINEAIIHHSNKILLKATDNQLYITNLPLQTEIIPEPSLITEKISSLSYGPDGTIVVKCMNQTVHLWNNEDNILTLKERYPTSTNVSYSEIVNVIFFITEYNEFSIIDSKDGSLLVNYNVVDIGLGAFVSENNKLVVVYVNGKIKWFLGTIDRQEIAQLRTFLTKRVENVESNILRIHSGFQKIANDLDNAYLSSIVLKNNLNRVKVFKQQLKKLVDNKLIERTSILRDLYFRLLGYQNQVKSLLKLINDLEGEIEESFKKSKENELSDKTPKERIEDYLNLMKPRDQIGLGTLAETLQLPYEDCLTHLKNLESRGLLPGFLTRGSSLSIKDNVIFVKKDPKFEETGITSF